MDLAAHELVHEDRAGLRVVRPAVPVDGPAMAVLLFRVGKADETLRTGGITHLVEHLTLFPIGRQVFEYNGRVEDVFTSFYARGEPDEVAGFLARVTAGLSALPVERMPTETRVLAAEGGGGGFDARLMALRYGPAGHGLSHHGELGLGWLEPDAVLAWARERFTRGNAVLWSSIPLPEDLALELPDGPHHPPPPPVAIPRLDLPAQIDQGTGGVALTMAPRRSTALTAALMGAVERAHDRLRTTDGLTYAVGGGYDPLDADTAHVVLNADCVDPDAPRVRDGLLAIVDELAADGPTEDELERDRRSFARGLAEREAPLRTLDNHARDLLLGSVTPLPDLLRERDEVTPASAAAAMAQALESLLVLVPTGVARPADRPLKAYAPAREAPVAGERHAATREWQEWGEQTVLVEGPEGVSLTADADALTIAYDECVAAIAGLGSTLTLVDRTGSSLTIRPGTHHGAGAVIRRALEAVGDERFVPLTARERELEPIVLDQLGDAERGRLPGELDWLPVALAHDEDLRLLAQVTRGKQTGLLVLTDRRLLFLFAGAQTDLLEVPLAQVRGARSRGMLRKSLVVDRDDGEPVELTAFSPGERLGAFAAAL